MKIRYCFIAMTALLASTAQSEELFETLKFREFHDPGWMITENNQGQLREASFYYTFITYEDIKTWKEGETLNVYLSESSGVVLEREVTKKRYTIDFTGDYSPIDLNLEACKEKYDSTVGLTDCYGQASLYQEGQIKAFTARISDEIGYVAEDMIKAQKAAFDAYVKSKWALTRYQDSKSEWRGTIQNVIGANYYYNDMKHFAGSLKRFMQ